MKKYDVIIVGAGPAGVFCALELAKEKRNFKVLIIDEGAAIEQRRCKTEFVGKCTRCKVFSITHGFAGAGAFSDCKLSLYNPTDETFVGGELESYMSTKELKELLDEVVDTYKKIWHSGTNNRRNGASCCKRTFKKGTKNGLNMTIVPFLCMQAQQMAEEHIISCKPNYRKMIELICCLIHMLMMSL